MHCAKFDNFMLRSYSQEGEDMILRRLFEKQSDGFYVDVGAHHPKRFSNTFIFYSKGWKGINIDAMPGSMKAFNKQRPRDKNLEIPIAKERKNLTYFQFNEPALNGFCEELAVSRDGSTAYKIISKQSIEAYPLSVILDQHLNPAQSIDFLSVDVEGLDLEVLQSNDWLKFRPKVVLVEILNGSLDTIQNDEVYQFLTAHNYHLYAKAVHTVFFISDKFLAERMM
ncbi:MAG: SAM-dependent methyltransferase [Anabaena sp. LE011-02]|nr:MAG: SAM-dependent methyltransferase [Anabaena sp. LE011-02]